MKQTIKEEQFTPGEWEIQGPKIQELSKQIYFSIITKQPETKDGSYVMPGFYYPHSIQTPEEMEANSRLIASAPNMYNYIKELVTRYENSPWIFNEGKAILNRINKQQ